MAKNDLNKEGLIFEEWVCTAGVAVIDKDLVQPYSKSYTYYKPKNDYEVMYTPGDQLLVNGIQIP